MKKTTRHIIAAMIALAISASGTAAAQSTIPAGGTGWSTSTVGDLLVGTSSVLRYGRLPAGAANYVLKASSTSPFRMEWAATSTLGMSAGSGTVTSVSATVPTGLSISGSPITSSGTLAFSLQSGYVIPLTASTTQWATAFGSTTALTPAYIRGLLSGTSPISFNSSTGAISLLFNTANSWTGTNAFSNASSTNHTVSNALYLPGMASGCLQVSAGIATSTGTSCGGGSGNSAFAIGSGLIYNATSTDMVGIGTSSPSSTLHAWGSFAGRVATVSATTTLDSTHFTVIATSTSGDVGINLPSASSSCGRIYNVYKSNATGSRVTIDASGSETIGGSLTKVITSQHTNYQIQSDCSSNWMVLSNNF